MLFLHIQLKSVKNSDVGRVLSSYFLHFSHHSYETRGKLFCGVRHGDALVNAGGCSLESCCQERHKQLLYVDFTSLIQNFVHVSLYIILLFSVNEGVEMEIEELSLHVPVAYMGLERAHESHAYFDYRGRQELQNAELLGCNFLQHN